MLALAALSGRVEQPSASHAQPERPEPQLNPASPARGRVRTEFTVRNKGDSLEEVIALYCTALVH